MNKNPVILCDVDDVLLHCNSTALSLLNKEKGTNYRLEEITRWGLLGNELDERLKYFSDSAFVRNQNPYEGAILFIEELRKRGEVFFATDIPASLHHERVLSLMKHFNTDAGHIVTGSAKWLFKADFLLDDKVENIVGTSTHKSNVTYPILFRRPWNESANGLLTVSSFTEALTLIDYILSPDITVKKEMPRVISLVGPSGSGKNDIAKQLCERGDIQRVRSYTTNPQSRDSHVLLNREYFLQLKEEGMFFETSCYLGEYYGTMLCDVQAILSQEKHALLVVDINGAIAMQAKYKDHAVSVFVERDKKDAFMEVVSTSSPADIVNQLYSWDYESSMSRFCDMVVPFDGNWKECIEGVLSYD